MFVQITKSARQSGKTYFSYLVRESFRTAEGPRSRTVCNISDLPAQTRDLIAASLQGQDFLPADQVHLHDALDYGGLAVLNDAWTRFQLDRFFAAIGSARQRGLLKAIIYSRLLFPCAKLFLSHRARGTWLAAACGLDAKESFHEDDLYNAMDQLNGHWVSLEKQLYQQAFTQAVRLVLYDLTSVYFEGQGPEHLAHYGHSRDHRSDRPQIILAVATDTEGVPLHLSVLRGNRGDTRTLQGLLHTLRRRFGIQEATFVFDGGMSSRINLEAMSAAGLGYMPIGLTHSHTTPCRQFKLRLPFQPRRLRRLSQPDRHVGLCHPAIGRHLAESGRRVGFGKAVGTGRSANAHGAHPPGQALRHRRWSVASTTRSAAPTKPHRQSGSRAQTAGGGKAKESGCAKVGQPGRPKPAATQGAQVFCLSRGRGRKTAVGA